MKIAMIDLDVIVYKAAFAAESRLYTVIDESVGTVYKFRSAASRDEVVKELMADGHELEIDPVPVKDPDPVHYAYHNAKSIINRIVDNVVPDKVHYVMSAPGDSNFRLKIATLEGPKGLGYKAGRPERPYHYTRVKDYILNNYDVELIAGAEADDYLGLMQHKYNDEGHTPIICSVDKDLLTCWGWHYNIDKGEFIFQNQLEADLWFWKQMLLGDSADNIPGIKGIGAKKADAIIDGCQSFDEAKHLVEQIYLHFNCLAPTLRKIKGVKESAVNQMNKCTECLDEENLKQARDRFNEVAALLWIFRYENQDSPAFEEEKYGKRSCDRSVSRVS